MTALQQLYDISNDQFLTIDESMITSIENALQQQLSQLENGMTQSSKGMDQLQQELRLVAQLKMDYRKWYGKTTH